MLRASFAPGTSSPFSAAAEAAAEGAEGGDAEGEVLSNSMHNVVSVESFDGRTLCWSVSRAEFDAIEATNEEDRQSGGWELRQRFLGDLSFQCELQQQATYSGGRPNSGRWRRKQVALLLLLLLLLVLVVVVVLLLVLVLVLAVVLTLLLTLLSRW